MGLLDALGAGQIDQVELGVARVRLLLSVLKAEVERQDGVAAAGLLVHRRRCHSALLGAARQTLQHTGARGSWHFGQADDLQQKNPFVSRVAWRKELWTRTGKMSMDRE